MKTYIIDIVQPALARWTYRIEAASQEEAEQIAGQIARDEYEGQLPDPDFDYECDLQGLSQSVESVVEQ